jgi:rare lipoprotein A
MEVRRPPTSALLLSVAIVAGGAGVAGPVPARESDAPARVPDAPARGVGVQRETPVANPVLDRSGKKRVGIASVYAPMFVGRKMADGTRMAANDDNAASKTLPLGTQAEVTNLKTGQSATVTIQDRGPYVKGRIIDLSPATADQIGLEPKEGITKVEVKPITLPPPEGDPKN